MKASSQGLLWRTMSLALLAGHGAAYPFALEARADQDFWPIKPDTGYIAFGDSYAAGMGAGETTWAPWPLASCRKGSNSYGQQLSREASGRVGIKHEFVPDYCSGDTTIGANRQIDSWAKPETPTLATLSIGGNDLKFSELLTNCVITPESDKEYPAKCAASRAFVESELAATGEGSFREKLKTVYKKVLAKAGHADLQLYVTGYPRFFNDQTDWCDNVTFYWWDPKHYDNPADCADCVFLTRDLRQALNQYNLNLNALIQDVIKEVNTEINAPKDRVYFIDTDAVFEGRRWCEFGIPEPQPENTREWFFLSSWPDVIARDPRQRPPPFDPPNDEGTFADYEVDVVQENVEEYTGPLPDPATCSTDDGGDDPIMSKWYCLLAERGDEIRASHVHEAKPTRWVKTFHPRSIGYTAIMHALIAKFKEVNVVDEPPTVPGPVDNAPPEYNFCQLNLQEYKTCQRDKIYKATVEIRQPDGLRIDAASRMNPDEAIISGDTPLTVPVLNDNTLAISANDANAVHFSYGGLQWDSTVQDAKANAYCEPNQWQGDPLVDCSRVIISKAKRQFLTEDRMAVATRGMTCYFQC